MCAPCCYSFRVISTSVNPKPLRDSAIYGNLQAWLCGDQTGLVCVSLHITEATEPPLAQLFMDEVRNLMRAKPDSP